MGQLQTLQDNIRGCKCNGSCKDRCKCKKRTNSSENVNIINIGNAPYRNNSQYGVIPPVVIPPPSNSSHVENNNDYHDTNFVRREELPDRPSVFETQRYVEKEPVQPPPPPQRNLNVEPQYSRVAPTPEVKKPEYFLIFEDRQVYPEFY